jgi:hypothetical protein
MFKMFTRDKWPGNREYLGTVHTFYGDVPLHMPSMGDVSRFPQNDPYFTHRLAACAANISLDHFLEMNYTDGMKIMQTVCDAVNKLSPPVTMGGRKDDKTNNT